MISILENYQKRFEVRVNFGTFFEMINQMSHDVASTSIYCFFEIFFPENAFRFSEKVWKWKVEKTEKVTKRTQKAFRRRFWLSRSIKRVLKRKAYG